MTRPGIAALIPTLGEDVVAIFRESESGDDVQVLEGAHLIQATVGEDVTFYKHPLENGRNRVDHRIIQPVTIDLRVILTDRISVTAGLIAQDFDFETTARDIYNQMRDLFLSGTLLSIQTRTATYPNQIFQAMPHEETAQIFDGVVISVSASEIQFETANTSFSPVEAEDSDTVDRGKQNPLSVSASVVALLATRAASIFEV